MEIIIDKEFKDLIPLDYEGFLGLEESIKKEGNKEEIVIWKGKNILIDGYNRYKICKAHDIPLKEPFIELEFESRDQASLWIIENQTNRRNLNKSQKAIMGLKWKKIYARVYLPGRPKKGELVHTIKDRASNRAGKKFGVSGRYIDDVEKIEKENPGKIREIFEGKKTIKEVSEEIKKERKEKEIQKQKEQIKKLAPLKEKYDLIAIDPPWNYGREYDPKGSRVASPYPEMDFDELKKIQLPAEEDSILLLWTTHQFIWEANELMKEWGFEYKAILVWDKEKMGMGSWFRMQCEFCLLGIKGKPLWDATDIRDIIKEPRTAHSVKPEGFYKMAETICVGKKLDYFNNGRRRKGWDNY